MNVFIRNLLFFIIFFVNIVIGFADENDFIQIKSNRILLEIPKNWDHIERYDKNTSAERIRIISKDGNYVIYINIFKKQSENIPYGVIFELESEAMLKQVKSMPEFSKFDVIVEDNIKDFYDRKNDGKLREYYFIDKKTKEKNGILKYYMEPLTIIDYFVIEIAGLGDEPIEIDKIIKSIKMYIE